MSLEQPAVPVQRKGASSDTRYSVRASNEQAAKQLYQNARLNLLNVNGWQTLAGNGVGFQLINDSGEEIFSLAETGNYFRIHIPALPRNQQGKGDEWVLVEKIEEGKLNHHEYISMRVRPAVPPFPHANETAHFFSDDATSTFCVVRNESRVVVSVSGRNETPNTDTHDVGTWMRNVILALGAMIGLNKPLWKNLAKGIIKKKGAVMRT